MNDHYDTVVDFVEAIPTSIDSIAICGTSYTETGGIARVIEQQAIELTEHGFTVEINVLTGDKRAPDEVTLRELGRFETTPYKELDKLLIPATPSGWRFLSRMADVDLVITHRFPFSILSYFASKTYGTEYVFWSHPSQSSDELFDGVARAWAKLQHHMETANITVRNADHVCAVSKESKSYIESKIGRDAIYIPNRVPDSRFIQIASEKTIQERYDIEPTDIVVLHVGRITPRKSIDKLVESFEAVTAGKDGYKLVLVGKENMDAYSATVREKANQDVIFTGFVEDDILAGFYERSDVYATCSLSEGWGLPLSEANRFGTPIVAYDSIPAVRSIENAVLATDGNGAEFETKLASAIGVGETKSATVESTDVDPS